MEAAKRQEIFNYLDKMTPGQRTAIVDISPSDIEGAVEAIKEYIDAFPYGGFIEFNNHYRVIRKLDHDFLKNPNSISNVRR